MRTIGDWKKRIHFYSIFFRSTLAVGIPSGIGVSLLSSIGSDTTDIFQIIVHLLLFIPVGLLFDLTYKELAKKHEYYFYFNQGINKSELWISSLCLSFLPYVIFQKVILLWSVA